MNLATIIRPTVCGYSKRQRFDVVVNILTNLAYNKGEITVSVEISSDPILIY